MKILATVALVLLAATMRSASADYLSEVIPDYQRPPSALVKALEALISDMNLNDRYRLENFSSSGGTFLSKRFDRKAEKRIHIACACSIVNRSRRRYRQPMLPFPTIGGVADLRAL